MRVRAFLAGLLGIVGWTIASPASGQADPTPHLDILADSTGAAERSTNMLGDGQTLDLLRNGFPARMHFRTELWTSGGLFNHLVGWREWDVVVRYDPLDKKFRAARLLDTTVQTLGSFDTYAALATALASPFELSLLPPRRGRYYYLATLDVEMLSMSDLEEVQRWLKGELGPAVRGQRNPGSAVGSGLRTLFLRMIGGERRHYEARSKTFRKER